jgi:hypothetical protein
MCFAFALAGRGWALDAWLPPQARWTRYGNLEFVADAEAILVQFARKGRMIPRQLVRLEMLDAQTGDVRFGVDIPPVIRDARCQRCGSSLALIELHAALGESRGKLGEVLDSILTILIPSWPSGDRPITTTRVFGTSNGDEVFCVDTSDPKVPHLSPDGRSLMVLEHVDREIDPVRMRCFDIPRRVSLLRVAALPFVAGVLLLAFRGGRSIMRRRVARDTGRG